MEKLSNKKFTELSQGQMLSSKGGGTFWIGDTNTANETSGNLDTGTRWKTDSTKNNSDIKDTDNGDTQILH